MTRRIAGTLLILLGALGIVLSVLGVIGVWRVAENTTVAVDDSLASLSETLEDVDQSLNVVSNTLDGAAVATDGLYTTTLDVSQTLSSTRITIDEMAALAEDDLPQSIEASLVALEALEETAGMIDQVLRGLQRFGVGDYAPEVPLDQAVAETSAGLEPVPESLRLMGAGLRQTGDGLEDIQRGLVLMRYHMMDIRQNVVDAEAAVTSHRTALVQLQTRGSTLRGAVARPIRAVGWAASLLLVWIGLSQLAILHWGIRLWQQRRPQTTEPQDTG
ncbi:MAG: hypothetical protein ACLFV5_12575, partial [Anaerolineales bacterium]